MKIYKEKTFAEAYKKILIDLIYSPENVVKPRDQQCNEFTNLGFEIDAENCLYHNERRSSQFKYIGAELIWYFSGRNDLKFIEKYAKFWKQVANEDDTLNSAYGNLLFTIRNEHNLNQWQWAYNSLKSDKDTRQAIMHFNMPKHQHYTNKDFVCTLNAIFNIRDNKLNMTLQMRSNDVVLGLPTDVAFFSLLQQQMYVQLKELYPDLELGKYTHISSSMHLYERNFKLAKDMLDHDFISDKFPDISSWFINKDGEMTKNFKLLHDAVVDETENVSYSFNDHLFGEIFNNINDL